ncbi:MAG: sulfatase-like hydrolase/transferase [Cyclobacteriaceae bacterium]
MKLFQNVYLIILVFGALALSCNSKKQEPEADKPNIVLIYTDDQTYETIHALGNDVIRTPNMDKLVDMGTTFTHAYNMGGWHGAVCVASRSMMNSGAFVWNAKKKEQLWVKKDSAAISETWSRLMANAGYNTYMTGKWHVQAKADEIFQQARHIRPGMPGDRRGELGKAIKKWEAESGRIEDWNEYMPAGYGRPIDESDNRWSPTDSTFGGFWQGGKHWSEVVKDDALDFINEAKGKENPFFMYLAFNAPHDPRQAPQEYIDMYPLENIEVPDSFLPEYPWKDDIGNSGSLRDEALAPYPRTEYAVKKHIQEYYAIISHLDTQVGEILNALEQSGRIDNTYIFFTADHGLAVGQHGLIGKQTLFDHSMRVPLMVMGPNIPKGAKLGQDVYLQDIMATSLELAGIPKPDYVEFNSFSDIIDGSNTTGHYDAIYGCYVNYQRMIRKNGYKLLVYPDIQKVLLFDLKNDPEEINDISADAAQKERVKKMFQELLELQKVMGDELDISSIKNQFN